MIRSWLSAPDIETSPDMNTQIYLWKWLYIVATYSYVDWRVNNMTRKQLKFTYLLKAKDNTFLHFFVFEMISFLMEIVYQWHLNNDKQTACCIYTPKKIPKIPPRRGYLNVLFDRSIVLRRAVANVCRYKRTQFN